MQDAVKDNVKEMLRRRRCEGDGVKDAVKGGAKDAVKETVSRTV